MLEIQTPAHHITGATQVHLNSGRLSNAKLSSADSNSSLSSNTEPDDKFYKLIAVHRTAGKKKTRIHLAMWEEYFRIH